MEGLVENGTEMYNFIDEFIPFDLFCAKLTSITGHCNVDTIDEDDEIIDHDVAVNALYYGIDEYEEQAVVTGTIRIIMDQTEFVLTRIHNFMWVKGEWEVYDEEIPEYCWTLDTTCRFCSHVIHFDDDDRDFDWLDSAKNEFEDCTLCKQRTLWKCIANRIHIDKNLKRKISDMI